MAPYSVSQGIDKNQAYIIEGLHVVGASTLRLNSLGGGVFDILIGYNGRNYLMEIKNPCTSHGQGLSPEQMEFQKHWNGGCFVCRTLEEVFLVLGIYEPHSIPEWVYRKDALFLEREGSRKNFSVELYVQKKLLDSLQTGGSNV